MKIKTAGKPLFASLFLIALSFQGTARAELNITISAENKDLCAQMCRNVVGSPPCRHAYYFYRNNPPLCRITSERTPKTLLKGTYGIWSRDKWRRTGKTGWLNASDFGKKPPPPRGGLAPGWYLARMSGSGWFKGAKGNATRSSGHENIFFGVYAKLKKPELRRGSWRFPAGYDQGAIFKVLKDYYDQTRAACKKSRRLNTSPTRPHMWTNGPRYTIVHGPYSGNWKDTPKKFGERGYKNNHPRSRSQWKHHYTNDKAAKALCKSRGVNYVY